MRFNVNKVSKIRSKVPILFEYNNKSAELEHLYPLNDEWSIKVFISVDEKAERILMRVIAYYMPDCKVRVSENAEQHCFPMALFDGATVMDKLITFLTGCTRDFVFNVITGTIFAPYSCVPFNEWKTSTSAKTGYQGIGNTELASCSCE